MPPPHLGWSYSFFSRQKHIYILDPPSRHKKGSLPHNFHILSNFSGYLEFWLYECTCLRISHYFLCTLQVWVLFYLDKSEFSVQKLRFWTHTWGRQASGKRGHTQPLMVLNRQLECGFSKGSPSLINTFALSLRWAASWNASNCHWLEKMFICFS